MATSGVTVSPARLGPNPSAAAADGSNNNTVLADLIDNRSWSDALSRLRTDPAEASQLITRSFGSVLPLHEACKLQAPADVVEALIVAYPPAVKAADGGSSSLPLHLAAQTNSHEAVGPLLKVYPSGARKKDDRGRLPIHLGCEWRASAAAVEALLVSYPESVYVRDADGKSPMDHAVRPKTQGDASEIVEVLKKGTAYCAVSKSAHARLKKEFDSQLKKQIKAHEANVAEIERTHADEVNLHRQLEEGYRDGLKSLGQQSSKFRQESIVLKKDKSGLVDQLKSLKTSETKLQTHVESLEEQLLEKTVELREARSLGDQRGGQVEEHGARISVLERDLSVKHDMHAETEKSLHQERATVEKLTEENEAKAAKISELTIKMEELESQLKEVREEAQEKGSELETARTNIESLEVAGADRDDQIAALEDRIKAYEAQVEELTDEMESKEDVIESSHGRISDMTFSLHSMTEEKRDQARKIVNLNARVESLESNLSEKTAALAETSAALVESRGRMEVLLRNLDSVLRHNVEQAESIEALNGAVVSLSASLNAFVLPPDVVQKAKAAQAEALSVILDKEDNDQLAGKLTEKREAVASEAQAMDDLIRSAELHKIPGIKWEHYVPPVEADSVSSSSSVVSSTASLNFSSVEEKEKDLRELTSVGGATKVIVVSSGEEEPVTDDSKGDEDTEVGSYKDGVSAKAKEEVDDVTVEDVVMSADVSVDSSLPCADDVKSCDEGYIGDVNQEEGKPDDGSSASTVDDSTPVEQEGETKKTSEEVLNSRAVDMVPAVEHIKDFVGEIEPKDATAVGAADEGDDFIDLSSEDGSVEVSVEDFTPKQEIQDQEEVCKEEDEANEGPEELVSKEEVQDQTEDEAPASTEVKAEETASAEKVSEQC